MSASAVKETLNPFEIVAKTSEKLPATVLNADPAVLKS